VKELKGSSFERFCFGPLVISLETKVRGGQHICHPSGSGVHLSGRERNDKSCANVKNSSKESHECSSFKNASNFKNTASRAIYIQAHVNGPMSIPVLVADCDLPERKLSKHFGTFMVHRSGSGGSRGRLIKCTCRWKRFNIGSAEFA
jgi:hypothetical protein